MDTGIVARGKRKVVRVVHPERMFLGVGEVGDVIEGKPPVIQVWWSKPEKYGLYLSTSLRRVEEDSDGETTSELHVVGPE